jgi:PAS domain S-box-containing protein
MNLLSIISLTASVLCLGLGIAVLALNRKPLLNKLFFLMALAGFFYNFTIVMMWTSPNFETAYIWHKAGTMWPLFVASLFNFALVYTQSKWLKNKLNYILIYAPAVVFFLISLSTEEITAPPVVKYWGYNDLPGGTWIYFLSAVWTAVIPVLAFLLCVRYYRNAKDYTQKQSGKLVTIGFAIPIATYILTNVLAPALVIEIPNIGIFSTLFSCVFIGYAIHEYELFVIDDALAAENIINTVPDALVLTDVDGNILRVNEKFINRSGYSQEELIGQSITRFCIENGEYTEVLEKLKRDGLVRDREIAIRVKSGETRSVLFSGSIILSRQSKPLGLTCIVHDITERKRMEDRLVKTERLASIGELAGQLGHDLRNPLAGIKNGLYLLRKKGGNISDVEREELLQVMGRAVEDSNRIVTSLIDYSSDLQLYLELCSSQALVDKALKTLEIPRYINVKSEISDYLLNADVSLIANVLACNIQNAVQAIPQEGTIQITSCLDEGKVKLSIIDSGVGIPKEVQSKIFKPLVTTKAKGMGMSLAISKRIVEAHDGKITIHSEEGNGTRVNITLPHDSKVI